MNIFSVIQAVLDAPDTITKRCNDFLTGGTVESRKDAVRRSALAFSSFQEAGEERESFEPDELWRGTSLKRGLEQFERGDGVSSDWLFEEGCDGKCAHDECVCPHMDGGPGRRTGEAAARPVQTDGPAGSTPKFCGAVSHTPWGSSYYCDKPQGHVPANEHASGLVRWSVESEPRICCGGGGNGNPPIHEWNCRSLKSSAPVPPRTVEAESPVAEAVTPVPASATGQPHYDDVMQKRLDRLGRRLFDAGIASWQLAIIRDEFADLLSDVPSALYLKQPQEKPSRGEVQQ